ncbi:hypothetical protein [Rheinheimera sp. WS51]|uniref:hypothetical protein n=1 Tax=Rheinheimera sp. WS51 TaxID=3425886 RepID=UPI003D8FADDE
MRDLFKFMVLLLLFIELIWLFVPRDWAYFGHDMAAGWNGAGGVLSDEVYRIWSISYSVALLVVYFALYNYIKWAPRALLVLVCIDLATTSFLGISVFTGFDLFLYKLILICSGAVLAMAYFSDLKKDFVRKVGSA